MSQNRMTPKLWGMLLVLSCCWGGSFLFVEVALREIPPFTVVFLRVGLAAAVLYLLILARGYRMPRAGGIWISFFIMGLLNNFLPHSLIVWGQTQLTSGEASILNATTPIFTVLLAHFLTHDERLVFRKILGVLLGFAGVYFLMLPELQQGFSFRGLGQMAVICSSILYSLAGIFGKRFRGMPPLVSATGMLTCSSLTMLPVIMLVDSPWTLEISALSWLAVLWLSVIGTSVAYLLYFRVLSEAGSNQCAAGDVNYSSHGASAGGLGA